MNPMNLIPIIEPQSNYIKITEQSIRQIDVFLDDDLGTPADYRDLLSILFNNEETDNITLFINSPGGQLDTCMSIVEGIKHSNANVTAVLLGSCHSALSIITMYCHSVVVTNSAYMLIHNASYGSSGTSSNVKAHTDFTYNQIDNLLNESYEGFLSDEELANVKKGVELWFSAEEIKVRLELRAEYMKEKYGDEDDCDCDD